jgi:pilus assembly protein Flp/PilA
MRYEQVRMKVSAKRGAALLEYALLAGLVSVVALGSVNALGGKIERTYTEVGKSLSASSAAPEATGPTEPEVPSGPTGTAASSFTVTMADRSGRPDYRGYYSSHITTPTLGSLADYDGPSPEPGVVQFTYDAASPQVILRVLGSMADELPGHIVTCESGLSLAIDDATGMNFEPGSGRTQAYWNQLAPGFPETGVPTRCQISDS